MRIRNLGLLCLIVCWMLPIDASHAAGWSNWGVPTRIDVERGNGIMIWGDFGNPNGCTVSDAIYVHVSHFQYDRIYAMALTAFTSGKELIFHSNQCDPVTWYSVPSTTYNYVTSSDSVNIRNPS